VPTSGGGGRRARVADGCQTRRRAGRRQTRVPPPGPPQPAAPPPAEAATAGGVAGAAAVAVAAAVAPPPATARGVRVLRLHDGRRRVWRRRRRAAAPPAAAASRLDGRVGAPCCWYWCHAAAAAWKNDAQRPTRLSRLRCRFCRRDAGRGCTAAQWHPACGRRHAVGSWYGHGCDRRRPPHAPACAWQYSCGTVRSGGGGGGGSASTTTAAVLRWGERPSGRRLCPARPTGRLRARSGWADGPRHASTPPVTGQQSEGADVVRRVGRHAGHCRSYCHPRRALHGPPPAARRGGRVGHVVVRSRSERTVPPRGVLSSAAVVVAGPSLLDARVDPRWALQEMGCVAQGQRTATTERVEETLPCVADGKGVRDCAEAVPCAPPFLCVDDACTAQAHALQEINPRYRGFWTQNRGLTRPFSATPLAVVLHG